MPLLPVMPPQPVIEVFPPSSVAVLIHGRNDDPMVSSPPTPANAAAPSRARTDRSAVTRSAAMSSMHHVVRRLVDSSLVAGCHVDQHFADDRRLDGRVCGSGVLEREV